MDASADANGVLVFGSGGSGDLQLLWMDRNGKQIGTVAEKVTGLQLAKISPQGDRIALQIDAGVNDIWVLDLVRGVRTRLTFGPVANTSPLWSPDGKWIAYMSKRGDTFGLYRKQADGSGAEEVLSTFDQVLLPSQWSRDGKYLFYSQRDANSHGVVYALPLQGERKPHVVVERGNNAQLSPNGHWLAYSSAESGTSEVYVVAFGGGQGKWQVSPSGGQVPQWSSDGKELYYLDSSQTIVSVPVKDSGGALQFGVPQSLVSRWTVLGQPFYDVTPDGKRILGDRVSQQLSQSVTVVSDFTAGLKK
jgi:Tol biopolymer transport system component